jgi:hypothetical protein
MYQSIPNININQVISSNQPLNDIKLIENTERELMKKINDEHRGMKDEILSQESKLQTMNVNLTSLEKYFTPSHTVLKKARTIEQIYALTSNLSTSLSDKQETARAKNFLSKYGISLTKAEKEISDLKHYMQTRYDLKREPQKIATSELVLIKDSLDFFKNYESRNLRLVSNHTTSDTLFKKSKKNNQSLSALNNFDRNESLFNIEIRSGHVPYISKSHQEKKLNEQIRPIITPTKKQDKTSGTASLIQNFFKTNVSSSQSDLQLNLFDTYFEKMKIYFYFACKNEILQDQVGFLFNPNAINQFNRRPKKSNFIPITVVINELISSFSDQKRKNLFELLLTQLDPINYLNDNIITVNKMLNNSILFYEKEFLKKLSQNLNQNFDYESVDYKSKIDLVKHYVQTIIYSKQINNEVFNQEKLSLWGLIFFLMRSGSYSDLIKYLKAYSGDEEIIRFRKYLDKYINENELDPDTYLTFLNITKSNSEMNSNPFKHACMVLVTKTKQAINENLFANLDDYIWFHLNLIIKKSCIENLKNRISINANFLELEEFQDFIKRTGIENFEMNSNIHIDYARSLFSILLFEDGINHLASRPEHLIDTINISVILKALSLTRNLKKNNTTDNVICNEDSSRDLRELNKWLEVFVEKYMRERTFHVINYIKFTYSGTVTTKLCQIFKATENFSALNNPNEFNFQIGDSTICLSDVINENEIIEIVSNIIISSINLTHENKFYLDSLISLAMKYNLYSEVLQLIISDCIEILTIKTPKSLFKTEIHSKSSVVNPSVKVITDSRYEKSITQKYREIFNDISAKCNNFDNVFKTNFKFLRQLEVIEEIYDCINNENKSGAFSKFKNQIYFIPFKSEDEIKTYIDKEFNCINDELKKMISDVCYLFYFLLKYKLNKLKEEKSRNE